MRATLQQVVLCRARGYRHVVHKIIQKIEGPGIEPNASSNWSNKLLPIPATVPSINSCRILNLSYILIVTLDIPRASDLHVTIPITVGNVPFRGPGSATGSTDTYPASQNQPSAPGTPYPPSAADPYPPVGQPPAVAINYSATHPPVDIGLDNYTMGETQYAPVYGFVTDYRFAPPPSHSEATVKVKGGEE